MIYALGCSLEIVRTVLRNATNDIYVCKEKSRQNGSLYTCIRIKKEEMQKEILNILANQQELLNNVDYVGSFVLEGTLNLLFLYHNERKLDAFLELYINSFELRCKVCKSLIGGCQTSGFPIEWIYLLLDSKNVNVNPDGSVYFNYFIDFECLYKVNELSNASFNKLAESVFAILSKEYKHIYNIEKYPKELRLFHKKMTTDRFNSFNDFYKYLAVMPKELTREESLIYKLKKIYSLIKKLFDEYATRAAVIILVVAASVFCIKDIINRDKKAAVFNEVSAAKAEPYKGVYDIGTVKVHETSDKEVNR